MTVNELDRTLVGRSDLLVSLDLSRDDQQRADSGDSLATNSRRSLVIRIMMIFLGSNSLGLGQMFDNKCRSFWVAYQRC